MFFRALLSLTVSLTIVGASSAQAADVNLDTKPVLTKSEILEALRGGASDLSVLKDLSNYESSDEPVFYTHGQRPLSPFQKAIAAIKTDPKLQSDKAVQTELVKLYKHHPFTYVRTEALSALPLSHSEHAGFNKDAYYYSNLDQINYLGIRREINKEIGYCAYGKPLKPCTSCQSEDEKDALTPIQNGKKMKNVRIAARDVEAGKLVGYANSLVLRSFYYSDLGKQAHLGLHYVPDDKSLETKFIYPHNVRYISERTKAGHFWGVTSSPGKCRASQIVKIKELGKGQFHAVPYRNLLTAVEGVGEGESGELYLYFGGENHEASQCDPILMPIERSKFDNNPPVIMTTDGKLRSACVEEAIAF